MTSPSDEDFVRRQALLEVDFKRQLRFHYAVLELMVWVGLALLLGVVLFLADRPDTIIWRETFNFLHVLLSTVSVIAAFRLCDSLLPDLRARATWTILLSAFFALGLGIGLEAAQLFANGTAAVADMARDVLGVVAGLALTLSLKQDWVTHRSGRLRLCLRAIASFCVVISFIPTVQTVVSVRERADSFPMIADFEEPVDKRFVSAENGARLTLVAKPDEFVHADGNVGMVIFEEGRYSKLEIEELAGDWSEYAALLLYVYSPFDVAVSATIRVHDALHDYTFDDRFNRELTVAQGENRIVIPIREITQSPGRREMRMDLVKSIILFLVRPEEPVTLLLDSVQLVSEGELQALQSEDRQ